jgi:hypothetical protein
MMNESIRIVGCAVALALACSINAAELSASDASPPNPQSNSGDRPTPAQSELMQGVTERRYQAAIEKADSEHQAEMKKCEGLVWEEQKLCKDQVSTETAQSQAKAAKDRNKREPAQ